MVYKKTRKNRRRTRNKNGGSVLGDWLLTPLAIATVDIVKSPIYLGAAVGLPGTRGARPCFADYNCKSKIGNTVGRAVSVGGGKRRRRRKTRKHRRRKTRKHRRRKTNKHRRRKKY